MNRAKWLRIIDQLPPENQEVETKIDDHDGVRNERILRRARKLWFNVDGRVMNYTPTHWRAKQIKTK